MLYGYKILAFCTYKTHEELFQDYISSLTDELAKQNWRVFVFTTDFDTNSDTKKSTTSRNFFELINFDITDALLISEGINIDVETRQKLIQKANSKDIPTIILGGDDPNCFNIRFNQKAGFERIVKHVIEHHRVRDLHFMAGTRDSFESLERLEVFKKVLNQHAIPFNQETMVSYGDFWDTPTRNAMNVLLKRPKLPKAIICANDIMAITVAAVLKENDFYCPEDVIVTGFDGIKSIKFTTPKITSAICDAKRIGYETARLIFELTQNKRTPFSKLVETTLFISESCGCTAKQPANTLDFLNYLKNCYNRYRFEDKELNHMSVSIHDCKNVEEVIQKLKNSLLYNVICLVKPEFLIANADPNVSSTKSAYGDTMFVIADSDYAYTMDKPLDQHFIKTKDYIPRMEEILNTHEKPLFFTPVNNSDLPIGYLCFTFNNYDDQNYTKIGQISSWLGNAFSGYRNMQYQRYLQTKLEQIYQYDTLTGLYNRNGFIHTYNKLMDNKNIKVFTMVMCDLDNLKHINDNFSHNEGDNAISVVGKALSTAIEGGQYCRYGGDEIIGIFPKEVSEKLIRSKIKAYIDNYNATSNKPYKVSTSIGIITCPKASFEELFAKADKLMYDEKVSKKAGR